MTLINIQKLKKIKMFLNSKVKKVRKVKLVKEKLLMIIMTKFMKILLISNNFRCNEKMRIKNNNSFCNNSMSQIKNKKNQISKNTLHNSMPNNLWIDNKARMKKKLFKYIKKLTILKMKRKFKKLSKLIKMMRYKNIIRNNLNNNSEWLNNMFRQQLIKTPLQMNHMNMIQSKNLI